MKKINDKLAAALASAKRDIPSLERIMQLAVLEDASDASGALGDGCVLLAIASIDNDNDGGRLSLPPRPAPRHGCNWIPEQLLREGLAGAVMPWLPYTPVAAALLPLNVTFARIPLTACRLHEQHREAVTK